MPASRAQLRRALSATPPPLAVILNGAGLAMATMDMSITPGASRPRPLDVGCGAAPSRVAEACSARAVDRNVKPILVTRFAGIQSLHWVAQGVVLRPAD